MDRLSQALAAGFNAPVVYIQLPNGILVAPTAVRAVRYWSCPRLTGHRAIVIELA